MLDFFGFSFSCFSAFCWDAINIPGKSLILLCPARTRAGTRTHARTHARPRSSLPQDVFLRGRRGLSPSLPGPSSHSEDLGPPCCPGPPRPSCLSSSTRLSSCLGLSTQDSPAQPWATRGFAWVCSLSCSLDMLGPLPGLPGFPARRTHSLLCAACCLMTEKCLIF